MDNLIAKLEGAAEGSRELDALIAVLLCGGDLDAAPGRYWKPGVRGWSIADRYTTSLDAALTLVPEGWVPSLVIYHDCSTVGLADDRVNPVRLPDVEVTAPTPALALVSAALKARAQQEMKS